jgi:hypothetical protein
MKIYEVELKYESYTTVTVEANSPEEAEDKAWQELETDERRAYGEWSLESIEELKGESDENICIDWNRS